MKKSLLAILIMAASAIRAHAYSYGDIGRDVIDQTHLTILQGAIPGYFYDLKSGKSNGGVISELTQYRFVSVDAGWITPFDPALQGSIVLGGSIHVDRLARQLVPDYADFLKKFIPASAMPFWDRLTVGSYLAQNFDENTLTYGLYGGLEFKF